jgi:hypothetical protein
MSAFQPLTASLKRSTNIWTPHTKAQAGIVCIVRCFLSKPYPKFSALTMMLVTFASATILLAAVKCPDVDPNLNGALFETCWDRCLFILDHFKKQIHSAPRATQVLQKLRNQIMGTPNQGLMRLLVPWSRALVREY